MSCGNAGAEMKNSAHESNSSSDTHEKKTGVLDREKISRSEHRERKYREENTRHVGHREKISRMRIWSLSRRKMGGEFSKNGERHQTTECRSSALLSGVPAKSCAFAETL